ncbi:hypothetical protein Tco_0987270 [Tanacetum coccineum]
MAKRQSQQISSEAQAPPAASREIGSTSLASSTNTNAIHVCNGILDKAMLSSKPSVIVGLYAESQRRGNLAVTYVSVETKCSDSGTIKSNFFGKWASPHLTLIEEKQATIGVIKS